MIRSGLSLFLLIVGCLGLASLSGCGSSDGNGPKLAPVTGRVVFKNEGVTAASIFFIPDAEKGNRGDGAQSVLQKDGSFTMETNTRAGVIPGAYKIKLDLGRRPEKELEKYRDVKTSGLTIDVPEQGIQDKLIELK